MKRLPLICTLTILTFTCYAQSIDTLNILKTQGKKFIIHKISNPNTYISLGWSEFSHIDDGLSIINVFTTKNSKGQILKLGYTFRFNKNMELVSVNTDPIEKQLKELKEKMKRAEEEKTRIMETEKIQLKGLKNN